MDVEEIKKLARNKIEAEALTKHVRDKIKTTIWKNKISERGFERRLTEPHIESQDSVKKSVDKQQDEMTKQSQANQLDLTQGLNQNKLAKTEGFDKMVR